MAGPLYWQQMGDGPAIVLLHGWGMNGAVWTQTAERLSKHFTVHVVDLPGYGYSANQHGRDLADIAEQILATAPERAVWLGWSLGGLVATYIAYHHPVRVSKLITVASSPKFAAQTGWRGIKPQVLSAFTEQLVDDFQATIERFMALQAMGSPSARQDVKILKKAVLSRPLPNPESLLVGLEILRDIDLRPLLPQLAMPLLRLYGRLDGLVPIHIANGLMSELPHSEQHTFVHSSHAPFMTEMDLFCTKIVQFSGK